uniref:Ubiquinone biosynthesis O-methyltransferase, mitochondrial n=1 Tax=Panagrellus redivivus TaxID=6233 RepID=A0A7E4ZQ22_PANRE
MLIRAGSVLRGRCLATASTRLAATSTSRGADPTEIATFDRLSHEWMDEVGPFKPLHSYNRLRLPWILGTLNKTDLTGLRIADVGCGGGLISMPLVRLGARVDAIDASPEAIKVAELSAKRILPNAHKNLSFHRSTAEKFAETRIGQFDAVVASEIVEHVSDLSSFLSGVARLAKPGAPIFITTINKTVASQIFSVWLAEDVLGLVPPGVHDWEKFVEPDRLSLILEENNCRVNAVQGVSYNPVTNKWSWSSCDSVNYALTATRV